jgi:5-methylcytosine-specific restriction endonuclease McrA
MVTRLDFSRRTQQLALARQKHRCGSCGSRISCLGESGRADHPFGEIAHAHHLRHAKLGGLDTLDNCVIICQACHYSVHEGGNYRYSQIMGQLEDFPYFNG